MTELDFAVRYSSFPKGPRMDFLNKSIAQVSELFRSMTPGARVTAGLLLAVVVVSMGYLFRQGTAGADAYLFGGEPLPDGQLTRVEAAIAQAGLSGFEREGNRIRVPAGQQAAYLAAVADAGALPPNFNTILENALDSAGPWEPASATRERLKIARQQTLSEIVRAMYWVEDAVVLYDEQDVREPGKFTLAKRVTASVNVQPIVGETLDPRRAKMLQKLVAHAVNMQPQDVNVTNLGDGGAYGSDGGAFSELIEDEFLKNKIAFEMQKRESILNALRDIPGIRVEVNADFNDTVEARTRNVKPDKTSMAPSREVTTNEQETQYIAENGGRPGVTVQGPTGQGAAPQPEQQIQKKSTNDVTETDNVVGVEQSDIVKRGYTLKRVWATVTIPSSYIENIWKSRNPAATDPPKPDDLESLKGPTITNVENIVEPLLILEAHLGENTHKHVQVNILDSLPVAAIEPPSTAGKALAWTGRYWSTLAMLGVAMFSLMVLRSVVKNGPVDGTTAMAHGPTLTLHADEPPARADNNDAPEEDRPRLRLKKGKSLKDDLVEIVREDPDAAADILRSWIGKAG
jgi:flagellar M-ring protein FliF